MAFLTYEIFKENAERNFIYGKDGQPRGHWKPYNLDSRWKYHAHAINLIRTSSSVALTPEKVLECGTMGAQLVNGSHTIDYDERWTFDGFNPTYRHDVRVLPWPIADKQYEWFVALRVYHHLWPLQRECFREALRIANNVLILVPATVSIKERRRVPRTDAGVTPLDVVRWNYGRLPHRWERTETAGDLYWCSDCDSPSSGLNKCVYVVKSSANMVSANIAELRGLLRSLLKSVRRRLR